ncbi:hypothetical protein [Agrococcus sp. KRD186]|uniref:hypothetical protein n=1 Tax=Agrococcus sp. KRD186 TaxID=2729730 RepID=UPI0019CFB9CD|nr:hypothetical protein [Agrococcus sp. KRD186]
MTSVHLHTRPRVEVDPNRHSRRRPGLLPVPLEHTPFGLTPNQRVTAVQSDDRGPDFVGVARVAEIDAARGLVYLDVDWQSFQEDAFQVSEASGLKHINFVASGKTLRLIGRASTSGSERSLSHTRIAG